MVYVYRLSAATGTGMIQVRGKSTTIFSKKSGRRFLKAGENKSLQPYVHFFEAISGPGNLNDVGPSLIVVQICASRDRRHHEIKFVS